MFKKLILLLITTSAFSSLIPHDLAKALDLPENLSDQEVFELAANNWHQNKERWEFVPNLEEKRDELEPIFRQMGYLDCVPPKANSYDYVLVIGATLPTIQKRIRYLEDLLKQGLQLQKIIFLGGKRPLLPAEREQTGQTTEKEMIEWVYNQSKLPHCIETQFIDAPMRDSPHGLLRPGTIETIGLWLESKPNPGHCLILSGQPYLPFHEALVKNVLPNNFTFDLTGEKAAETWTVALVLDTFARRLGEIKKQQR